MFLPVALKHKEVDFRGCQSHGDRPIDGIQETLRGYGSWFLPAPQAKRSDSHALR